jgi:O-antigen ligase
MEISIPNTTRLYASHAATKFPRSIQRKINLFAFFLAFPAFDLLSFSVTFYFFIALIIDCGAFWKKSYKGKILFTSFLIVGTLSTLLTPIANTFHDFNFLKTLIQFYYWIGVASFFTIYFHRIDLFQLSKWIFYGALSYTFAFYVLEINFESAFISITCTPGRNAYVFNILATAPMCYIFLKRQKRSYLILSYFFFLTAMLISNGRSGSIIILIELLMISLVISRSFNRLFKVLIPVFFFLFLLNQTDVFAGYMYQIADQVEPINPRFANLIRGEEEGDLTKDKSWLIRKLMIDKGMEIISKHPFLGVGPSNFKAYHAELKSFVRYDRLQHVDRRKFEMNTSPHNTYLQSLTEFGIVGSCFFYLILLRPLLYLIRLFYNDRLRVQHLFLISLLGMCIHFYAIASLTGALPWFVIGLAWALLNHPKTQLQ